MSHTPFGYRITNGKAVIDNEAGEQVKSLYLFYLSGDSLTTAAQKAGIESFHANIGRILRNARYTGDAYYPAIINRNTFDSVQLERIRRAEKLGRIRESKEETNVLSPTVFRMNEGTQQFDDPFRQAEYSYSLIEREER